MKNHKPRRVRYGLRSELYLILKLIMECDIFIGTYPVDSFYIFINNHPVNSCYIFISSNPVVSFSDIVICFAIFHIYFELFITVHNVHKYLLFYHV